MPGYTDWLERKISHQPVSDAGSADLVAATETRRAIHPDGQLLGCRWCLDDAWYFWIHLEMSLAITRDVDWNGLIVSLQSAKPCAGRLKCTQVQVHLVAFVLRV